MITLLLLLTMAVIFTIVCAIIDVAWPVLLVLIVFTAIDVAFFKAIFGKKKGEKK